MIDSNSTQDVHCSTTSITYNRKDLPDAASRHPEETVVYVADEMFRPYILLKDIDGKPYWRPYDGQPIENVRKYHKWELEAQRQFKDTCRSQEELDALRNVIMSVQIMYDFLEMDVNDNEGIEQFLALITTKTALLWYCKDTGVKYEGYDKTTPPDEAIQPYLQLAWFYIKSYMDTMNSIKENVCVAKEVKPC